MESRDTSHDIRCVVCSESYEGFATECLGTLGNDVPFQQDATDETTFPRWIARIMGFPNAEATHNVKVWITWD